jgi:hypothetical protein
MPYSDIWRNIYGQIRIGVNPRPRPQIEEEQIFYDGIIHSLNCGSFTNYGTLTDGTSASGVTSVVTYSGGNGGSYSPQTIQSTGVTGLTATLQGGFFLHSGGTLTYTITGTPNGSGTASFAISVAGQTCTLTRNVETSDAFILSAQLSNGDVIDGRIGGTNGYYKVEYWDGTQEVKATWVDFQKTYTGASGVKLIKIWPCDANGTKGGEIFDVNLTNNKYLAFTLNKVPNLRYLTVKNNQVITKSDLNFSLLTKIEGITLENLPAFTGSLSFSNISYWFLPIYWRSNGTTTNNRSEWDGQNRLSMNLNITNLPITSLDLSNLGGLDLLQLRNCSSLTTINTTNCTNLETFDVRQSLNSLQPLNLSTSTYLSALTVENAPNVTSITLPQQPLIKMLNLRYISITSLDLSAMNSLTQLSLYGISTLDSTLETSLYSNTSLRTTLTSLYINSINLTTANFSNFSIQHLHLYDLTSVSSISLPSTTKYLDIYKLPSMSASSVDSIFVQLDGFGLSNGWVRRFKSQTNDLLRTNSSDSYISSLQSKGWNFYGDSFATSL